jgi:hypothetical protein
VRSHPGPPTGPACTVAQLRRVLGDEAALDLLPLRIAGRGGAYRVYAVQV